MYPARRGRTRAADSQTCRSIMSRRTLTLKWSAGWILMFSFITNTWAQDDVPPYFKMEPVATQIHLEGNRLVLTCMAEGSWPLEFKWLYNGTELTRFSLEYRYVIPSLDRSHAGFYRCIVRNRVGALMQRSSQVQVAYMEGFVEGERSQVVSQGEAALISPPQIHSFPRPGITWFRDGRKIPPSSRIALTLDNTLVILSAVAPDAGRYYAQAVNDKNGENKTSQPIILNVENVGGPADPIAPSIIIPPRNTSVMVGTFEVTLECVANARPLIKLSITWRKNGVLVNRGLRDFGRRLTISGPLVSDSGYYECEASLRSSSAPSVSAGAYLHVLGIAPNITAGPSDSAVIDGMSIILHCETSGAPRPAITWQKADRVLASGSVQLPRFTLLESGSLLISPSHLSDAGSYTCMASNSRGIDEASADLVVWARTRITNPPQDQSVIKGTKAAMTCGVTHDPSVTVRHIWEKGGAAIDVKSSPRLRLDSNGTLHLSQTWSGDIGTYTCKVTSVGGNDSRNAHLRVRQLPHAPENLIATLSSSERRTINLTWAQAFDGNSPLIRYILEVSENNAPWTVLLANIDPEASSVIVGGLIPARSYQFRLCAVNDVGKGQFSRETVRRFTWSAPSPQFINGINQGYKLLAWEPGHEEDVTLVTVRPNFQDSVHVGYIAGLKKFTEYFTCVLCFTTPGDGPRSTPLRTRTHEDTPGPVGHLSFTEILDTSLKVSWKDPPEKNGILTGYRISWEEFNRTNTRVTHYLPNLTQEYRVTGLTALTTYTIQVAGMTSKGQGQLSSSTISSGVPPEMPGPPTNIAISNISPRSVTLQFKPGYDGKTSISCWLVEAQIGVIGENEEWVMVHQLASEPDARSLEVQGLNPYTYYRFRMRQVNIVGTSPPSQPSRKIQTLQAPPDIAPANITLRTASETSLWLRWVPLPEWEYNGNPELVGYRVQYSRLGSKAGVLSHIIPDRQEREFTIEDLEEWTEYEVKVQAFNGIGPGPWSQPVNGRTRESAGSTVGNTFLPSHIRRLKPFTSYQFRVKATNDIGDSEYSEESEAITTLQDAPDKAPTILSVTPHTTTSVLVRWKPPPEEEINGILLGFRVRYRELRYDRLRSFTVRTVNSPSANWAELTAPYSMRNLTESSLTQYELDNLNKHKRYEIRLSVYNAVGEGPTSSPQEVFVGEAVPTAPPQNAAIQSSTATQLDVTWDPPPVEAQNGDIQGYKIYYWEFQLQNETERLRTLFLPELSVKLKNLTGYTNYMISVAAFNAAGDGPRSLPTRTPETLTERLRTLFLPELSVKLKNLTGYTNYMISVAAFNAAGDGPRSLPTRGRTQQAAPSAPSFIHFSELTTTSVNMSWGEPKQPNGIVEGYRVVYEPCTPVDDSSPHNSGVSKVVTVDVKGSAPLWMKIKDLADGVTYNFRIRAKTLTYGPEIEANITTGPGEGAPGPPGEPFISRYGSALTLHWSSGDPGRAPVTRYVIEARPSDEGLWDILIKDIPKEVTSYTLNLDTLREGVTYDFRVIAVNDYGYGSPSAPSPSISAQKVSPFYEEWWFLVVIALVGLIFILLLIFILIIRGQSRKYTKKTDSGAHSNCTSLPLSHGEMVRLDEGRFPALELNNRRLSVKNSFYRKNGIYTRSPPRPSPGSLHYSDEDVSIKYNDLVPAESSSLTEKPSEVSDSQVIHPNKCSDSEYELDPSRQKTHSFVNHYISDPTYYNSWRRQQKGVSRPPAYGYAQPDTVAEQESRPHPPPLPPLPPLLPGTRVPTPPAPTATVTTSATPQQSIPAAPGPGHPVQAQGQPDSHPVTADL
ncbi:protein sidekick-2-like [Sinocyclocheilus rhinocerous]|uniref:protein sidekick-2-like n=1 Tax=Sinocyclocheilus rhinocerous TaxID=307959 RepID=UPI0007B79CC8|nr:PREDICTED: protein sidekick-2-like [Sinocyclocheilus rhinocerous]